VAYNIVGDSRPNKIKPSNVVDAQFSLYFQVAAALLDKNVTWDSYDRVGDPKIGRLAEKMHIGTEKSYSKLQTKLSAEMAGASLSKEVTHPKGDEQNPLSWPDIKAKFKVNALSSFSSEEAEQILDSIVLDLEKQRDMRSWIRGTLRSAA